MLTIRQAQMDEMEQVLERPVVISCDRDVCPLLHFEKVARGVLHANVAGANAGAPAAGGGVAPAAGAPAAIVPAPAKAGGPVAKDPPPQPVTPSVVSRKVVVVKKKHTNPARAPVFLKTDKAFTGKGTFTAAPADTILFFTEKKGGAAIRFDGKQNVFAGAALSKGVTLYAEGAKVSGSFNDVTVTLNLSGGAAKIVNNPRTDKMTAIDVSLQICKPRKAAGADPPTLSEVEKIDPGRALHVQNSASTHLRPMLIVGPVKPAGFTGQLELAFEFHGEGSAVLFLNEKQTDKETPSAALDVPVAGKKVFVEGVGVSGKLRDTKVVLRIKGLENDADHVFLTIIEAKLDVYKSREKPGKAREPMPDDQKASIGRYLHIQDAAAPRRKRRALVVIRQVKPAAFVGKLTVTPIESLATPPTAPKVKLFAAEDPAGAAAALAMPLQFNHGPGFPATGERRFAEGAAVSTALTDSGFVLGVQDVEDECDRILFTVYQVQKVEVRLARTRCRRAAAGDMPPKVITTDSLTFDATTPTVVRGCGDVRMKATVVPAAVSLSWDVSRAADDAKSLTGLPGHVADGDDKNRKVTCNATGSFHVFAFVDSKGKAGHAEDEDGVVVNLNMIEIKIPPGAANNKIFSNPTYSAAGSGPGRLRVDSGTSVGFVPAVGAAYGDAEFLKHPFGAKVTVQIFGGGANQRRGISKVTLGYNQTTTADTIVATYSDGKTERESLFVLPVPPASIVGARVVKNPPPPAAPPALIAFPVRDTRGASNANTGIVIISSSDANGPDKKNLPGGGEQRVARMVDPPAIIVDTTHPVSGSALASIAGSNNFEDFLVAFSSDFDENYTAFATCQWSTTYGTFTAGAGWTNAGAAPVVPAAMTVLSPPSEGDKTNMERCTPNFLQVLMLDAR